MAGVYSKLIEVVARFREIYPEFPIQAVQVFLIIADKGTVPMKDLADEIQTTQASVSRLCMLMSERSRQGKTGLKLVTTREDPEDWRRKVVSLTPKGKKLANDIAKIMASSNGA